MLCPAVGLEHSKKVRELLYRRVLRAWRHNTNVTNLQNKTAKFYSYYTASESDNLINALGDVWAGIPDNSCFQLFFVWKGQVASIIGSKATAYYGQMTVEGYSESLRLKYYIINGEWIKG